ncbi:hypothetical protein BD560DRAFT_149483 [Blakeslea trispora]|nr:hypothetical protein BD560DRAFT_149483 [Blakeslea trispora]
MVFHLKTRQTSSISAELEKLMIVQGVMKLDKTPSLFMENEFGRRVVSKFAREKRQELYGRPAKLPAAFVNSIKDALEYFDEDRNQKSLKKKLALMIEEDDQKERILDVLVLIFHQLTVKKKANDEMRLQSGLISALCNLFKATEFHDPQVTTKSCSLLVLP